AKGMGSGSCQRRPGLLPYIPVGVKCATDLGEWCNGSTTDSGSVSLGSNPSSPAYANPAVPISDSGVSLFLPATRHVAVDRPVSVARPPGDGLGGRAGRRPQGARHPGGEAPPDQL